MTRAPIYSTQGDSQPFCLAQLMPEVYEVIPSLQPKKEKSEQPETNKQTLKGTPAKKDEKK